MRIVQVIAAFLIAIASPAMAKDPVAAWIVTQRSGDVRVLRNGMQPASVNLRAALAPGDVIATGATGRAMLSNGDDYVVVAPSSRLSVPKKETQAGFTWLVQQVGTMLYKVKRTGTPHFAVETPMLAAVVKGTTFTVVVDENRAAVQVTEGVVEVSSASGNARRLVEGGMAVYVGRERPNEIIEVTSGSVGTPTAGDGAAIKIEGSGDVPLTTITDLTDGLVREAPVAPVVKAVAPSPAPTGAVADTTAPVTDTVATVLPGVTEPVTDAVTTTLPALTEPVTDFAGTAVPAFAEPVVGLVGTTVPATAPVVELVGTTVPALTAPVVQIVETTVPALTAPVVQIVETTVPAVTAPVIAIVETIVPVVTAPVVNVVDTIPNVICELLCGR